ncbi:hypothetical protein BU23DRAFT_131140 [Bimuria novae-zelandiae CBS 107.79]|uniref:Uncharacterized protein n=1 Tax=Bimuria novae-zelandiae CBS 107.79 TaxID=1447943 RepID=A0A6A5V9V4_9PLEO|nr:hypothetical protein BU23DRAFT_131140 [Bimuria novae-zelandiae CBS 107.79]
MVGWNGPGATGKWQETDLLNLIGIDPNTVSDLTWAMLESCKRKLVSKLLLLNPTTDMPKGVTVADINSFISDIDDIRRPWVEKKVQEDGETKLVLERGEVTAATEKEQRRVLAKILEDGKDGYEKTWDPDRGVPGNWLGENRAESSAQASNEVQHVTGVGDSDDQAGRSGSRARVIDLSVEDAEDGTSDAPVLIESDDDEDAAACGTRARPLMIEDAAHSTVLMSMDQLNAMATRPLYQVHRLRYLTPEQASPAMFRYAIGREELWKLAIKVTNNVASTVIGMTRPPIFEGGLANVYPEYIVIASLEGGGLRIRGRRVDIQGNQLAKWPGGGEMFPTLEQVVANGYLFRPFNDDFDTQRIKRYLQYLRDKNELPKLALENPMRQNKDNKRPRLLQN